MNYLDLLPCDVIKIINRKVQDAQIIKRRTERKENKRIQREKKQIADNKKRIYSKFVYLYERHLFLEELKEQKRLRKLEEIEEEKYREKINEQHEYLQDLMKRMYDTCTDYILESELCIGGEIPYLTVTFVKDNGIVYTRKFF
jgi:hypothetical protein